MHEPDVTLTDYALGLFCLWFSLGIGRLESEAAGPKRWVTIFFLAGAVAAFAGGSVHGFMPDEGTLAYRLSWRLTLLSVGMIALSCSRTVLWLLAIRPNSFWIGWILLGVYAVIVLFVRQDFWIAVVSYAPPMLVLGAAGLLGWLRLQSRPHARIFSGVLVSIVAAAVQTLGIGFHPNFDHNALYHTIQLLGLFLLYSGFKKLLQEDRGAQVNR